MREQVKKIKIIKDLFDPPKTSVTKLPLYMKTDQHGKPPSL